MRAKPRKRSRAKTRKGPNRYDGPTADHVAYHVRPDRHHHLTAGPLISLTRAPGMSGSCVTAARRACTHHRRCGSIALNDKAQSGVIRRQRGIHILL